MIPFSENIVKHCAVRYYPVIDHTHFDDIVILSEAKNLSLHIAVRNEVGRLSQAAACAMGDTRAGWERCVSNESRDW